MRYHVLGTWCVRRLARSSMPTPHAVIFDRQRGAIVGLAVGDALGAAVEFMIAGHVSAGNRLSCRRTAPIGGGRVDRRHQPGAGARRQPGHGGLGLERSGGAVRLLVAAGKVLGHGRLLRHRLHDPRGPRAIRAIARRPPRGRFFAAGSGQRLDHAAGAGAGLLCRVVSGPIGAADRAVRRVEPADACQPAVSFGLCLSWGCSWPA